MSRDELRSFGLTKKIHLSPWYKETLLTLKRGGVNTVCQAALCPNMIECFSQRTCTLLILGDHCSRNCRFCAVPHGPGGELDPAEPKKVADTVVQMGLHYVVVTSVTRDDLPDGGAGQYAQVIREIRKQGSGIRVEVLVPDFQGSFRAIETVLEAGPDVVAHNLETTEALYLRVRPGARYHRSLELLARVRALCPWIPVKSGLMLGLGEKPEEVKKSLMDLLESGCQILTLGQYLRPTRAHLPVERILSPEEFQEWKEIALEMGFKEVVSGPWVRSSYRAKELFEGLANQGS